MVPRAMADLVLLHGFTQTGRSWQPVAAALAGRYRAAAPDLPGHGAFAERRPATFPACDAYLRAVSDEPYVLCGYSMGGRVALHAAFAAEWEAQPLFAGMPRGVAELAAADRRRNTATGLAAALRGLGTGVMPSLWGRLPGLDTPVDLVVGERDEKFRAIAERMAPALPSARVTVVEGAGHAVHLEAPDAVLAVLRNGRH